MIEKAKKKIDWDKLRYVGKPLFFMNLTILAVVSSTIYFDIIKDGYDFRFMIATVLICIMFTLIIGWSESNNYERKKFMERSSLFKVTGDGHVISFIQADVDISKVRSFVEQKYNQYNNLEIDDVTDVGFQFPDIIELRKNE